MKTIVLKKFLGNQHTRYGKEKEAVALTLFQEMNPDSEVVMNAGLIINDSCPWFGFSPDGFEIERMEELILLEVKCPAAGKKKDLKDVTSFCDNLNFLIFNKDTGDYILKPKGNSYYSQIQMGLMLTNIKRAKLLVYSEALNTVLTIGVKFDPNHCSLLFNNLSQAYFKYCLPFFVKHKNDIIISKTQSDNKVHT